MTNNCSLFLLEVGLAAFDENNNLLISKKFDNAISSYHSLKSGENSEELKEIIEKLRSFDDIAVNDQNVVFLLKRSGLNSHMMPQEQQDKIQNSKPTFIVDSQLANNEMEATQALRDFAIKYSSSKVKEASEKLDLHIIQSINAMDELDKIINTIGARMREWYGLHFPELDNLIQSLTAYAEIVTRSGLRENINREILEISGIQDKKAEIIMDAARRSKGGDMTQKNIAMVKKLADEVISQSELRTTLADHIEFAMETVAPNIKAMLTASVGARIIAKAGSLSRLAVLPASTIQVLGAEKALFRALKTGTRPPKHGLLFQHPLIHAAPRWQRGKIARALASKVAIAARIDVYRHAEKDLSISKRLDARIAEIQEKYKEPILEKERSRRYNEHMQRQRQQQQQQQPAGMWARKKDRNRKKDRKRFGKRRY
jgi:nucleolar protein 56